MRKSLCMMLLILLWGTATDAQLIGPRIIYQQSGGNSTCINGRCCPRGRQVPSGHVYSARMSPVVVRIEVIPRNSNVHAYATGIIVDEDTKHSYVITSGHVTADAPTGSVVKVSSQGKTFSAKIVGEDLGCDVSLLETSVPMRVGRIAIEDIPLKVGQKLIFGGFDAGIPQWFDGQFLGYTEFTNSSKKLLRVSGLVRQGDSGGPIMTSEGVVVGIITGNSEGVIGPSMTAISKSLAGRVPRWTVGDRWSAPSPPVSSVSPPVAVNEELAYEKKIANLREEIEKLREQIEKIKKLEELACGEKEIADLRKEVEKLEKTVEKPIHVQVIDSRSGQEKIVDSTDVYLGDTLPLKLVPRVQSSQVSYQGGLRDTPWISGGMNSSFPFFPLLFILPLLFLLWLSKRVRYVDDS